MNFKKKSVAFYTLGCKVNQYETESIRNQLLKLGYEEKEFDIGADIYIINSCTVTSIADKKTRNILRRAKKINKDAKVIVTGCYAQTDSAKLEEFPEIDYIVGNTDKNNLVNFIVDLDNQNSKILAGNIFDRKEYEEYEFATLREMSRAYIKIQDGCNNFCSYCKIPFGRGRSRSRDSESIYNEIKLLVKEGYNEFIIIGINLGAYGEDLKDKITLEKLLENIMEIDGVERIRLGSVYPDKLGDEFIKLMSENNKMMPHLHISLQSCDDTVLKRMRREYGASLIQERLGKLKRDVKNIEFTADIIVGFPGESDEMFENSFNLLKDIEFSDLHVFQYSDREKTLASTFTDKIDPNKKRERAEILEKLRIDMSNRRRDNYIGKNLSILIEEEKDGYSYGYSENYLRVKVKGSYEVNKLLQVRIIENKENILVGEFVEKEV